MTPSDAGWYRQQTKAIGTITPSGNVVVERVTAAILQDFPEVSGHFSRIPVFGSSDSYKDDYDWDSMLATARLLSRRVLGQPTANLLSTHFLSGTYLRPRVNTDDYAKCLTAPARRNCRR